MSTVSSNPKCFVCGKTVYSEELIKTGVEDEEGTPYAYHKTCFRCTHCNMVKDLTSFAQEKGQIYCIQHYKEVFGRRGGYDNLHAGPVAIKTDNPMAQRASASSPRSPNSFITKPCSTAGCSAVRVAGDYCYEHSKATTVQEAASKKKFAFGNADKCQVCGKSAYPAESVRSGIKDYIYHTACFKCSECGTSLTISKFASNPDSGKVFCPDHFQQMVSRAGHYDV